MLHFQRILLCVLLCVALSAAAAPRVGDTITLKALKAQGVPLHASLHGVNDFERVPHGTRALILDSKDGWFRLKVENGKTGWIAKKYAGSVVGVGQPRSTSAEQDGVWDSLAGCEAQLRAGRRMRRAGPDSLLVGAWNLRWFSHGCHPSESCPDQATDVDWAACAIAWMDAGVLAVQEVLTSEADKRNLERLLRKLNSYTNGSWLSDFQDCGGEHQQHVGFLWNSRRARLSAMRDIWQLNPSSTGPANACADRLRPGRHAKVAAMPGGDEFHLITVHLDSGRQERDYRNRRRSIRAIQQLHAAGRRLSDMPAIIIGDFNTMGKAEGREVSAAQEIGLFGKELEPGYRRLPSVPGCSEYYQNNPGTLDHVVVSKQMRGASATARVSGFCAAESCRPVTGNPPGAYFRLSDHCPVLVEVTH